MIKKKEASATCFIYGFYLGKGEGGREPKRDQIKKKKLFWSENCREFISLNFVLVISLFEERRKEREERREKKREDEVDEKNEE